jgi:hypothetical protein
MLTPASAIRRVSLPTVDDEGAASLDAHARTPQGIAHRGQGTWAIVERDRQILHALLMHTVSSGCDA